LGEVEIEAPRDRNGSFEPKIVAKHSGASAASATRFFRCTRAARRRAKFKGISEIYKVEVSASPISEVTDAVLEDVKAWQTGRWKRSTRFFFWTR
jgi:putative transposase